jgi:hypothetical protein
LFLPSAPLTNSTRLVSDELDPFGLGGELPDIAPQSLQHGPVRPHEGVKHLAVFFRLRLGLDGQPDPDLARLDRRILPVLQDLDAAQRPVREAPQHFLLDVIRRRAIHA